ncbi:aminomethyl transferase family protein [Pseudolysinimonas yzui]|uniref:Glycine cleavage system protein T n=1 Tax=Pseudolysinimonas yzui TaxID=2708254 RepID=A0A8J3GT40_9MICO|nr:aminomethyl transferase family protein [Pseudolysinimonas yzui]GHF25742.1 glycine cleavage system protein T [Pseudolysinimonas yzui]
MTTPSLSLADAIADAGSPVEYLRNAPSRPTVFPVAPEFSNWRSEQQSWRTGCALLDQSHHMTDLFITGPDALRLLQDLAVNSFARFAVDNAKQFIAVNHEGFVIGDAILFHLAENSFDLVGHPFAIDWVRFNAETGGYDVELELDGNSIVRQGPPKLYRYELQGPNALAILERLIGGEVPATKFFHMTTFTIAGHTVRALRHGMAGQPGFELFGPWAEGDDIRAAILSAGEGLGITQVGSMAYSSANLESAWVPSPVPAIFSGEGMDAYRAWLPAARAGSIAGSVDSPDIEDYYVTPWDLGYERSVNFDHAFIGKAALEKMAGTRAKVTLVWDEEDVAAAMKSLFQDGLPAKYIALPKARYGFFQVDKVLADGRQVGISHDCGYIVNEQTFASLASIELAYAEPGTRVAVVWGENPNTRKPAVEPHRQVEIRATVAPAPFSAEARENYRSSR